MNRIIVTVTDRQASFSYDLEVPSDLEFEKLIDDIVQTLMSYNPDLMFHTMKTSLYIPKLKMKKMEKGESLDSIGVFSGDYLVIE